MKRILSLALTLCLGITLLAGCMKMEPTIATVNGEKVEAYLYKYFLSSIKQQLKTPQDVDAEQYWNETKINGKNVKDYAREEALKTALELVVASQKAKEMGIELTNDDKRAINQQKTSLQQQVGGTKNAYESTLASNGLTEATYSKLLEYITYQQKLVEKMQEGYTEDQKKEFFDSQMVNVKHILLTTIDDNDQPLQNQVIEQKRQKMNEIKASLATGADFDALLTQYNEDPGQKENATGYTLSKYSNFVEPFLSTALSLNVGQISDIIESNFGLHIIKRYEHVGNNELYTAAQTEIQNGLFSLDLEKWKDASTIEIKQDVIDKIPLYE